MPHTLNNEQSNFFFFFFEDTATTEIYTLSLHDALPICGRVERHPGAGDAAADDEHVERILLQRSPARLPVGGVDGRSEEHTSELQSRRDLVCRLLLEKKKYDIVNQQAQDSLFVGLCSDF